jgi:membrane-bound ClpP family serine protease
MVHGEHNKSKNSGGFALIILGALLLIIGPQEAIVPKSMGIFAWVGGLIIGGIGFYLKFFRWKIKQG